MCPPIPGLTRKHGKQRNCRGGPACPPIRWQKSEASVPELYKDQARRQTDIRLLSGRGGPACPPIPGLTGEHGKQRNCRGGPACPSIRWQKSETGKSDTIHILGGHTGPPLQYIFEMDTRVRPYITYLRWTHRSAPTVHI